MINTLLEHVPIKMEITEEMEEPEEVQQQVNHKESKDKVGTKVKAKAANEVAEDLVEDSEEDEEEGDDDEDEEEDDEEDEEESETETDALEIEQEAAMLISSDEEAELEAQKIRFPDKLSSKKSRLNSDSSCRSSSRNSNKSSTSITSAKITENNDTNKQEPDKKQRISPRLKALDNNANNNSNSNNNNTLTTTTHTNTLSQNNKRTLDTNKSIKNKQQESASNNKGIQNTNKTSSGGSIMDYSVNNKILENKDKENVTKSPSIINTTSSTTKSRRGSNNSTCSVASTVASDTAETESCGNIYVFNLQQKLIFNCEFCDLKYGDLDNFGRHLHEAHKLFNYDEDQEKENAPRNMRKSSRYSNSNNKTTDSLKKEPLQSLESLAETPPVALPLSVLAEPLNSCGNVFMLNHRKLFLVCGYCECKYANLDLFEKHLRQQHRIFEGHCNEVNVVPKIEIKEEDEDVSMTEVAIPQQDQIIPQAMVSIPAEIPLDISINPENQHLTEKALEDWNNSNAETEASASPTENKIKIVAPLKDSLALSNVASTASLTLQTTTAVENNKSITPHTNKNKRKSSPVKPSTSPNKRSKRNTRNAITKSIHKEEISTPMEQEQVTPQSETTSEELSSKSLIAEGSKSKDTKNSRKSLRSTETKKPTNSTSNEQLKENHKLNEIEEIKETNKKEIKENKTKEGKDKKKDAKEDNKKEVNENKAIDAKETENNKKGVEETEENGKKVVQEVKKNNKKIAKETKEGNKKEVKVTKDNNKKEFKGTSESNKKEVKEPNKISAKETKTSADLIKETKKLIEHEELSNTGNKKEDNEELKKTKEAPPQQENIRQLRERRKSKVVVEDNNEKLNKKTSEKSKEQHKKSTTITTTEEPMENVEHLKLIIPIETETIKKTQTIEKESENATNSELELLKRKNQCSNCGKKCRNKTDLAKHERTHNNQRPYGCSHCPKEFLKKQQLVSHERLHTGVTPFVCKLCKRCFTNKNALQTHNEKLHSNEKHYFTCEICQRDFNTEYLVYNHIEKEHGTKMLPMEDVIRDDDRIDDDDVDDNDAGNNMVEGITTNETELVQQMLVKEAVVLPEGTTISAIVDTPQESGLLENVIQLNEIPLQNNKQNTTELDVAADTDPVNDIMEQLQKEYVQNEREERNAVTFTIKTVPDTTSPTSPTSILPDSLPTDCTSPQDIKPVIKQIVKRFFCDQCPRSFEKHIRLVEHKRIHTGEKPYTCDECGKQFRIRMRLNEHKQRHAKEKKFNCQMCSLSCSTRNDLILHMRHHTNDRRFQCSMCPKAFVRGSDLKIHVRIHTGEKPYVCDICHKCFRANQNLSVHKKSHMGEASKSFQCEMCDKKFMRKIDRKVHMRSHTGEKPFKCEICDRGYSSRFNVRAHIERDHMSGNSKEETATKKRKPGPKPKALREELEKQKQLIAELQHHLLQQIKTDEKIIPCEGDFQMDDSLQDNNITPCSPIATKIKIDPVQSAYELLNKLKTVNNSTSKPLTLIPSPVLPLTEPPTFEPVNKVPTTASCSSNSTSTSSTLIPLTLAQKIEQHSPAPSASSLISNTDSCLTTPSPPKATTTKVVSQKTSLGIQQVSVTVSMQVENVTTTATTPNTPDKESDRASVSDKSIAQGANSVKKERKITSYFTVLGQKGEA